MNALSLEELQKQIAAAVRGEAYESAKPQEQPAEQPQQVQEWAKPAHDEINLATVNPEELGLDPFNFDDPLVKAIYRAQTQPTPFDGAVEMQRRGVPLIPLRPKTKIAFQKEWNQSATNDLPAIQKQHEDFPDANWACVAKRVPGGFLFLEVDRNGLIQKIKQELDQKFPETLMVRSSPGRGHVYFKHTTKSLALGNAQAKDAEGELWSLRADDRYVVAPMSWHPKSGKQYEIIKNAEIVEIPDWLVEYCDKTRTEDKKAPLTASVDGPKIPRGSHDNELTRIAGKLRQDGLEEEGIYTAIVEVCQKRCENYGTDYREMCKKIAKSVCRYPVGQPSPTLRFETPIVVAAGTETAPAVEDDLSEEERMVPPFDETVITGIYRDIVDLAVRGTTIPPQFAFLNAKVYLGARMAGRVSFEGLDCDSSYYGAAIGRTGTSKGESWRRTFERVLTPPEVTNIKPHLKVIYSADSGAGLKDAFFEPPTELPIVCYVDEVTSLGHKAGEKKNPEILDTVIELADSHRISRVKAKHGKQKSSKTHDNARLSVYMCGQDGDAFMSSFAGRKNIGLFDRLYPEFSGPIEPGLDDIDQSAVGKLHAKISKLNFDCKMTMSPETKAKLEDFWKSQPGDIRRKIRFKKYLILDMYMAGFGRGVTEAEPEDLDVAIKIFTRQIVIRKACFKDEIPDRVGFYTSKIKVILEAMRKDLNRGKPWPQVARSLRDFQTMTHAFRDNELHTFERAWRSLSEHITSVTVEAGNGQNYQKWVPMPYEHEMWLSKAA